MANAIGPLRVARTLAKPAAAAAILAGVASSTSCARGGQLPRWTIWRWPLEGLTPACGNVADTSTLTIPDGQGNARTGWLARVLDHHVG